MEVVVVDKFWVPTFAGLSLLFASKTTDEVERKARRTDRPRSSPAKVHAQETIGKGANFPQFCRASAPMHNVINTIHTVSTHDHNHFFYLDLELLNWPPLLLEM